MLFFTNFEKYMGSDSFILELQNDCPFWQLVLEYI